MEIIIILIKIALILFVGYASFIIAYRIFYNVSLDDAEKAVNTFVKDWLNSNIFRHNIIFQEPIPDKTLSDKLFGILGKLNQPKDTMTSYFKPNFYGFPVLYFDIVAPADTDFNLLCIQMKKITLNYWLENMFDSSVYVYPEKHGDSEYFIFVCYAVYEPAKTALCTFVENRIKLNRKDAVQRIAPVINEKLERELAEIKKGEDNERV